MRAYVYKRDSSSIEFGIIFGIIALLILVAARFPDVAAFAPACALKGFTGMPCPTCGSTRAVLHLAHGNVFAALAFNPLISACLLTAVLFFLYSLITLMPGVPRIGLAFSEGEKNALRIGAVMMVLVNWMYLIFVL
jgi:hypothetical protein